MKLCVKFQEDTQKIETEFKENKERICANFSSNVVVGNSEICFRKDVTVDDLNWQQVNGKWQFKIPQTTHQFKKINSIVAERKMDSEMYENMIYSYKRYLTGSIAVIVDEKINMKIIIKGEK